MSSGPKNSNRWPSIDNLGSSIRELVTNTSESVVLIQKLLDTEVLITPKYDGQCVGIIWEPVSDTFRLTGRNYELIKNRLNGQDVSFIEIYQSSVRTLSEALLKTDLQKCRSMTIYGELHLGDQNPTAICTPNGFSYGERFWKVYGVSYTMDQSREPVSQLRNSESNQSEHGDDDDVKVSISLSRSLHELFLAHGFSVMKPLFEGTLRAGLKEIHPMMLRDDLEGVVITSALKPGVNLKYKIGRMDDRPSGLIWPPHPLRQWTQTQRDLFPSDQLEIFAMLEEVYEKRIALPKKKYVRPLIEDLLTLHSKIATSFPTFMSQISKETSFDPQFMTQKNISREEKIDIMNRLGQSIYDDYVNTHLGQSEQSEQINLENLKKAIMASVGKNIAQMIRDSLRNAKSVHN